jgi:hypothetical protein
VANWEHYCIVAVIGCRSATDTARCVQSVSDAQKAAEDHSALQQRAAAIQNRVVELHASGSFEEAQAAEHELRDTLTNAERARKRSKTCKVRLDIAP